MKNLSIGTNTYEITDAEARAYIATLQTDVIALKAAVGAPLVASTKSAMQNTNKVYVYVGSESGMTNGNWYYWDGTDWTSGGTYNETALETDTTLSVSGKAADAKKVGDEVTDLKNTVDDLGDGYYHISDFVSGQYVNVYQSGRFDNYSSFTRTDYIPLDNFNKLYIITDRASEYNAFFTSSKTYISYIQLAVGLNVVAIPEGAKYVALSNVTANMLATKIVSPNRAALISNQLINKKYIFIGDSYCQGYNPDGNTTGWGERVKQLLGLNNDNCVIKCLGGTGFYRAYDNKTFSTLLDEAGAEYTDKKEVTHIVICGGYNDNFETTSNVYNAVLAMHNKIRTEYPNAKLYIGMIGASNDATIKGRLQNVLYAYQYGSAGDCVAYLSNVEYALAETNLATDGVHPNAEGQHQISIAIKQALDMGSSYIPHRFYNQIKTS